MLHITTCLFYKVNRAVLFFLLLWFCPYLLLQSYAQDSFYIANEVKLKAEKLWRIVDQRKIKEEIRNDSQLSNSEVDVIFSFLKSKFTKDLMGFPEMAGQTKVDEGAVNDFILEKLAAYLAQYDTFQYNELLHQTQNYSQPQLLSAKKGKWGIKNGVTPLGANEPCTNIDFE